MSNRKYSLKVKPSCWTCRKLKKSKRLIEGELKTKNGITITAPSIIDAISGYYCDHYWFGDKPDNVNMMCGGVEYKYKYKSVIYK